MHALKLALPALASIALATGCAHNKQPIANNAGNDATSTQQKDANPPASMKPEQIAGTTDAAAKDASAEESKAHRDLQNEVAELSKVQVFFEYDDHTLTKDGEEHLVKVGEILSKYPRLRIRIEGNCDERGTDEYNLALGQRRAETARKYLMALGAKTEQVETVSYGSEKPADEGHNEQAWRKNRRDDIVVLPGLN